MVEIVDVRGWIDWRFLARTEGPSRDVIRSTDFLDGMRGYAAFCVFISHFYVPAHPKSHVGYGGGNGKNDHWIPQLPIIRLIYSGQVCVFVFFVISGFSISLKPIRLARAGSHGALLDALFSATFRRAARLYAPCLATLLISLFLSCTGGMDYAASLKKNWPFAGKPLTIPTRYNSNWDQLKDWIGFVWSWSDPLNAKTLPGDMPYGTHLWTIPVEFKCSLISFISIIGVGKVSSWVRLWTLAAIGVYLHARGHPESALFLAGTVLAELHLIRQEKAAESPLIKEESRTQILRDTSIFILGLYLASYPRHGGDKSPFWAPFYPLAKYTVGETGKSCLYFFTSTASVLLVYIVSRSATLQRIFTTPLARYLGKTSFALYCVHQILILWFGFRIIVFIWTITGRDTIFAFELGMAIAFLMQTVVTICVKFTKWLEGLCALKA
ncbi:hypothetical protein P154DRAFT_550276 [Amniculicola lignicola CBS 123094]|uniref:Acyltransferase 3 domain-containing protein n=1 Tax=Amniculicola lignicola CBS 123094 TaxID=1392246 RepID=A0A6A5X5F5_9PLEO|nr:hypothetical protein P154DRAFT_550276 [Amniculicola lignicola CBS 123094]